MGKIILLAKLCWHLHRHFDAHKVVLVSTVDSQILRKTAEKLMRIYANSVVLHHREPQVFCLTKGLPDGTAAIPASTLDPSLRLDPNCFEFSIQLPTL